MSRSPEHRARMIARRERQLARVPGFEPVLSKRIAVTLLARAEEFAELGHSAEETFRMAWAAVARILPPAAFGRTLRAPPHSKNYHPAHRKAGLA